MNAIRSLWTRLFPNPGFYGWIVVGTGFLCSMLSSPGQSFAISLYLDHVMTDLGVSRLELSSLYGAMTLAAAACLPLVGSWADRLGGRRFLTGVLVLMAASFIAFARARGIIMLGAAFFALRLLGQGAVGLGTLTVTVRWFRRYRGRALAIVSLGYAAGEMVFPGVIYRLIDTVGWRSSLFGFALLYLVVFAPVVAILLRPRRAAAEPMDGASETALDSTPAAPTSAGDDARSNTAADPRTASPAERSFTLREALATPVFWGLLVCAALPPMVLTAVIFHQVALFESNGWSASLVPPAFVAFATGAVLSTYATGFILERVPSRYGLGAALGLMAVALASFGATLPALAGALVYGTLLGLASGTSKATNSLVWPDYFGIASLGALKGVVNAARNGATALGPPLAAVLMTDVGSFAPALLLFGAAAVAGGAVAVVLRPPAGGAAAGRDRHPDAPGSGNREAA